VESCDARLTGRTVYDPAMPFRLGHRPALDGVRGLAILTVMGVHTGLPFPSGGFLSVDVFFVLSGFLITSVLVEEWQRTGSIRLGLFYIRRALRLLPGLAVLLVVLGLWSTTLPYPAMVVGVWRDMFFTFFYVANWALAFDAMNPMGLLGHAWTLAIEEQFYLLWPPVVLAATLREVSIRAFAVLVAVAIVVVALHRALMWDGGATMERMFFGFDTRCDTLLAGCLAALVARLPGRLSTPRRRQAGRVAGLAGTAVLSVLMVFAEREHDAMYLGGFTIVAVSAGLMLVYLVDNSRSALTRAFGMRPLAHAGHISYGLYLWHWPVFLTTMVMYPDWSVGKLNVTRFAITLVLAQLSSSLVEQPALSLKKRWKR